MIEIRLEKQYYFIFIHFVSIRTKQYIQLNCNKINLKKSKND